MKRIILVVLMLVAVISAQAIEGTEVRCVSGTATGIRPDALGRVDLGSEQAFIFDSSQGKLVIPYTTIRSFEYRQEATHHLGVVPAIAVGLLKARQHKHLFRISYKDESNVSQAVILEVPKHMAVPLEMLLKSRAPNACAAPACAAYN